MAKKRKSRASEPEPSVKVPEIQQPEPEVQPPVEEPVQQIEEQEQGGDEQADLEPEQEQVDEMEDDPKEEEHEDDPKEEELEDDPKEEEHEDDMKEEEEGNETEAVNASNGKEKEQLEANGDDKSNNIEEEEEKFEEEPAEKLLEPFSKEQLVVLLKEVISKHPEIIESVHKLADADPARRKIFVHGLGWETTAETLVSEFGKYGEIEDCKAVVDKVSGKSKGYGFILFKHRSGAQKALKEPQKKIGNRMTSCQLASAGPVPAPPPNAPPVSEYTQRKIFVSNVAADIEVPKLVEFFSKFGEIEDGPLGLDKQTGKPKGFALFVYKTVESARKALEEPHKNFEGHTLHVQRAIDGPKHSKPFFQNHNHHQQQHHHHHHQPYHHHNKKSKYSGGGGGSSGHLMAPSGPSSGYNPATANPALTPALGQALTALLATQGAGLGIGNLLGGLGAPVNQGMPPVMNNNTGYGNQGGGYGNQGMQGGYQNPQMGQGGGRPPQGGGGYMGHGH